MVSVVQSKATRRGFLLLVEVVDALEVLASIALWLAMNALYLDCCAFYDESVFKPFFPSRVTGQTPCLHPASLCFDAN
jgi:hypothetical protein